MKITKEDLTSFLDQLSAGYDVYAPVAVDGYLNFKKITSGKEAVLDFQNTRLSPKGVLYPQSEKLFEYKVDDNGAVFDVPSFARETVIFGIRPCDARSLTMLDQVFKNDRYEDPYYWTRREKTVLVGLGCTAPSSSCFCTSVGGGPFDTTGLDVMLTALGQDYLVEALTEKGKETLAKANLVPESEDDKKQQDEIIKRAESSLQNVPVAGVKEKLDGAFNNPVWDKIYEKCLGCGVCTFVCPTCYCFDICDEASPENGGCRIRNWDSCMFPLFTLHASGHNPRPSGKERFRQRVMHKFKYFVDRSGCTACAGCGRCVKYCPVNLDIRQVVKEIQDRVIAGVGE